MNRLLIALVALSGAAFFGFTNTSRAAEVLGYTDTPLVPGQKWHVHDPDRTRPRVVTPGETFSNLAPPPSDADVLFNGKDLAKWKCDKGDAGWKVVRNEPLAHRKPSLPPAHGAEALLQPTPIPATDAPVANAGYMEVVKGAGSIRTREEISDFQLHLEFATPAEIKSNSQGRGNSGVIIFGKYEVQVLDTYTNLTYPDGQCGALYGQFPPLVNACKPPGVWQTYDIIFEAPRWDADKKLTKPASVTVIQNGVVLHHRKEYLGETKHREAAAYTPHPSHGFIELQDHGNPMRYRNIWIRKLGEYDQP